MSARPIKLEITGQVRGFKTTLSIETTEASVTDELVFLTGLLEKAGATPAPLEETPAIQGEPVKRLASELDVDPANLRSLIGFKGGMVQISQASQLKVTDAMCMLLYAYEKGVGESAIAFEQFESLVKQNGIKLSYPLTTGVFNLKQGGHIDRKLYDEEKKISLSPRGEKNAISAFKDYIAGKGAKQATRISKKHGTKKRQSASRKKA